MIFDRYGEQIHQRRGNTAIAPDDIFLTSQCLWRPTRGGAVQAKSYVSEFLTICHGDSTHYLIFAGRNARLLTGAARSGVEFDLADASVERLDSEEPFGVQPNHVGDDVQPRPRRQNKRQTGVDQPASDAERHPSCPEDVPQRDGPAEENRETGKRGDPCRDPEEDVERRRNPFVPSFPPGSQAARRLTLPIASIAATAGVGRQAVPPDHLRRASCLRRSAMIAPGQRDTM